MAAEKIARSRRERLGMYEGVSEILELELDEVIELWEDWLLE
jgi:hypothetical protein